LFIALIASFASLVAGIIVAEQVRLAEQVWLIVADAHCALPRRRAGMVGTAPVSGARWLQPVTLLAEPGRRGPGAGQTRR
jgi:hypothetical protein